MTDLDVTDVSCPTCKAPIGKPCTIRGRRAAHLTRADKHVRKYNREVVQRIDAEYAGRRLVLQRADDGPEVFISADEARARRTPSAVGPTGA